MTTGKEQLMENQDNFFNEFREQANQLREQPSTDAWRRIEQRMQKPSTKLRVESRRRAIPRLMGMAASLALLIGLSAMLFWLGKMDSQKPAPMAQAMPVTEWEELPATLTDGPKEVVQIAVKHPRPNVANPIVEGRPEQRLVARQEVAQPQRPQPSQTDSMPKERTERMGR